MPRSKEPDERAPLLQFPGSGFLSATSSNTIHSTNHHLQFCSMVGMPPLPHPSIPVDATKDMSRPNKDLLYQRALRRRRHQSRVYMFTASLANTLLLSQVVLGAALTALGASESSHILITVFGAMNTIIAGLVAYLKSRGQPMRARMYSEDLERLVDEIENSATMWLGISANVHGYDAIDTDDKVTVRGEVARLTRLWEAAVRRNVSNDPDMYSVGSGQDGGEGGLKSRSAPPPPPAPAAALPVPVPAPPAVVPPTPAGTALPASQPLDTSKTAAATADDPDAAPATAEPAKAPPPPPVEEKKAEEKPVETKPADAKPAESKPATEEEKPEETSNGKEPVKPADPPVKADEPAASKPAEQPKPDEQLKTAVVESDESPATAPLTSISSHEQKSAGESSGSATVSGLVQSDQKANKSLKRTPSGAPPGPSSGPEGKK